MKLIYYLDVYNSALCLLCHSWISNLQTGSVGSGYVNLLFPNSEWTIGASISYSSIELHYNKAVGSLKTKDLKAQ